MSFDLKPSQVLQLIGDSDVTVDATTDVLIFTAFVTDNRTITLPAPSAFGKRRLRIIFPKTIASGKTVGIAQNNAYDTAMQASGNDMSFSGDFSTPQNSAYVGIPYYSFADLESLGVDDFGDGGWVVSDSNGLYYAT